MKKIIFFEEMEGDDKKKNEKFEPTVAEVLSHDTTWFDDFLYVNNSPIVSRHRKILNRTDAEDCNEPGCRQGIGGYLFKTEDTPEKRAGNLYVLGMLGRCMQAAFHNTGVVRWDCTFREVENDQVVIHLSGWRPSGIDLKGDPIPAK